MLYTLRREAISPIRSIKKQPYALYGLETSTSAAYGLRKLRYGVTSAIRVRCSSDNAETDIGFIGQDLNVPALLAFVGAGSGYITTWYDQSGNGNHATQSTAANQPRIVNAGVLDVDASGRPTCVFDGSNDGFSLTNNITDTSISVNAVVNCTNSAAARTILGGSSNACIQYRIDATTAKTTLLSQNTAAIGSSTSSVNLGSFDILGASYNATSGAYAFFLNGSSNGSGTQIRSITNPINILGTKGAGLEPFLGSMSEVILFNTALSTSQRQRLERNQGKYYGISVA